MQARTHQRGNPWKGWPECSPSHSAWSCRCWDPPVPREARSPKGQARGEPVQACRGIPLRGKGPRRDQKSRAMPVGACREMAQRATRKLAPPQKELRLRSALLSRHRSKFDALSPGAENPQRGEIEQSRGRVGSTIAEQPTDQKATGGTKTVHTHTQPKTTHEQKIRRPSAILALDCINCSPHSHNTC